MTAEGIVFWVVAALTVGCALGVVTATKAVYSALFLAMVMIQLAVLYVAQGALFLGVVQVVVYTGAVMMLFLFVLMLVGVDSSESLVETIRGQRITVIVAGLGFGILLIAAMGGAATGGTAGPLPDDNVGGLAALIFTRYVWAFELTSALLITAALGAMVLAHRERFERRKTQRELAEERFKSVGTASAYPTTMPSSGVYALQNSVDTPALLPDGRPCDLSVSRTLERRGIVLTLLVSDEEVAP